MTYFPGEVFSNLGETMFTSKASCAYSYWRSRDIALSFPFYSSFRGDHKLLKGRWYALTLPLVKCLVCHMYILDIVLVHHYVFMKDRITFIIFPTVIQHSHEKSQGQITFSWTFYLTEGFLKVAYCNCSILQNNNACPMGWWWWYKWHYRTGTMLDFSHEYAQSTLITILWIIYC